jgi:starch synthase
LPAALTDQGVDARLMMPGYPKALAAAKKLKVIAPLGAGQRGRLLLGETPDTGLPVYLVDAPELFARDGGPYQDSDGFDWPDNAERFALLCRMAVAVACGHADLRWAADIVHANDWPTGLVPMLLADQPREERPATVFTIHNLAFQGLFPAAAVMTLGLPHDQFTPDGAEFYGRLSFLKAGIRFADKVTTVSPGYAREILGPEQGAGFEGIMRSRQADLIGIMNGVDVDVWNPAGDPCLPAGYSSDDMSGKLECKQRLQKELGLRIDGQTPIVASMSRLTHQKMADIVAATVPEMLAAGAQFVLIGEGDQRIETEFARLAAKHPGAVSVTIGYDEEMAHRIVGGADMLLTPARFEPCGLTAMYGSLYGTPPIGRRTGGLSATICDAVPQAIRDSTATGFLFDDVSAEGLLEGVYRAIALYRRPILWRQLQRHGMARDFSWATSAEQYVQVYTALTGAAPEVQVAEGLSPATYARAIRVGELRA